MLGIIELGRDETSREGYTLRQQGDGIAWTRTPSRPFAAKVNTSGEYDEVDSWNEYIQEDWTMGVGRVDPTAGGFLYGEAETRVPGQVLLPAGFRQVDMNPMYDTADPVDVWHFMPEDVDRELILGAGGKSMYAIPVNLPPGANFPMESRFWFYAEIPDAASRVSVKIYNNIASAPGAVLLDLGYLQPPWGNEPGQPPVKMWHCISVQLSGLTPGLRWIVLEIDNPTKTVKVGASTKTDARRTAKSSNDGSSWSNENIGILFATDFGRVNQGGLSSPKGSGFFRHGGHFFFYSGEEIRWYNVGNAAYGPRWDDAIIGATPPNLNPANAVVMFDKIWFSNSAFVFHVGESFSPGSPALTVIEVNPGGEGATLFAKHGPYLYRAVGHKLYYTADGTTWTQAFEVGTAGFPITGMAGMGDSLYVGTSEALYRFAPGNFVEGVTTWGSLDETNGRFMLNHRGSLYMLANGRVANFTPDGRLMDIWISRDDDMVAWRTGAVRGLSSMNNWLIAHVSGGFHDGSSSTPTEPFGTPSLWAFQDASWHHIGNLPVEGRSFEYHSPLNTYSRWPVYYDRGTKSLWAANWSGVTYQFRVPDFSLNPFNDLNSRYAPEGWLEQDRFYGGLRFVNKLLLGVRVDAENISASQPVDVFYKLNESDAWSLLGTATTDGEELRWDTIPDYPVARWVRLGFRMRTIEGAKTAKVRAVVLKFLPMVDDAFRDIVTVRLGSVQGPDGSLETRTIDEQRKAIESLYGRGKDPVTGKDYKRSLVSYEDPFGDEYEVFIADYSWSMPIYAYEDGQRKVKELEVTLVLEENSSIKEY
jgi:hypothetical protein